MEIEVTIDAEGKVTTRVKGACGRSCKDATKAIRDALGTTVEDRNLPEYYEQAAERTKVGGRS